MKLGDDWIRKWFLWFGAMTILAQIPGVVFAAMMLLLPFGFLILAAPTIVVYSALCCRSGWC
jgi:hypothetical protein